MPTITLRHLSSCVISSFFSCTLSQIQQNRNFLLSFHYMRQKLVQEWHLLVTYVSVFPSSTLFNGSIIRKTRPPQKRSRFKTIYAPALLCHQKKRPNQTFFVQIKYSKAKVFLLWTDTSVRLIFHVLKWIEWIATLIFILLKFACTSFLSFLLNWVGKLTQHTTDTCKNYFNVCPRLLLLWTHTRRRRVTTNTCKDIFMNEFFFTFLIITSGAHPVVFDQKSSHERPLWEFQVVAHPQQKTLGPDVNNL